jgi:hypothetical protein
MLASAAPPLRPLRHEDLSGSSASELTMPFWLSLLAVAAPAVVSPAVAPPAVQALPPVAVSMPQVVEVDSLESVVPLAPAPLLMIHLAEPFKLPLIADTKAYLNLLSILQYYLHCPEFSTQRPDNALITDSRNAEASSYWEGQIRVAVQDGSLHFLFENKGSLYDRKGFKMLAALN